MLQRRLRNLAQAAFFLALCFRGVTSYAYRAKIHFFRHPRPNSTHVVHFVVCRRLTTNSRSNYRPASGCGWHCRGSGSSQRPCGSGKRCLHHLGRGGGSVSGTEGFVSEGNKLRFLLRFAAGDYKGENVAYNGNSAAVGFSNANQSRSPFSQLLLSQNIIVRDGLLGGVLSTAWPLLRPGGSKPNLVLDGSSKVDKRPAYRLRYQPGNSQDIQILLYFDQETFRHLKSEYIAFVGTGMSSRGITMSSSLQPERTTLEEDFSDFQTFDGLNLPTTWKIHFTRERQSGSTTVSEWELKSNKIMHNVGLDPRNFEVK